MYNAISVLTSLVKLITMLYKKKLIIIINNFFYYNRIESSKWIKYIAIYLGN